MAETSTNNIKQVAKNTVILYVRMVFLMLISLYTSRVILDALGISDYGVYNVVGGVVAMFSMLTGSLSVAISRFVTYELGKGNQERLHKVFCTSVNVQVGMAVLIFVLAEVIGMWFLFNKLNIPDGRMDAAVWTMHCSILAFVVNLISVPYNACIIAHEKMSAFAYVSILEAVLKLTVAFLIYIYPYDKLKVYALLLLLVSIIIRLVYGIYCKRKFAECKYARIHDNGLLKEMFGFAGWNFMGSLVFVFNTQGINILINMFFGVILNAARGIATQVEGAVQQFVVNFTTALNPQITKSYAQGDISYLHSLVCGGAKLSFFLMWIFAVPICLEADAILNIWLKEVPDYAVLFVRWSFVNAIVYNIGMTLYQAINATGKVKKFQIISTCWIALDFPLTYIAFKMGFPVDWAFIIYLFIYVVMIFIRIYCAKDLIHMTVGYYTKEVVIRIPFVALASFMLPFLVIYFQGPSFLRLIEVCFASVISIPVTMYYLGLNGGEREKVRCFVNKKIESFRNGRNNK